MSIKIKIIGIGGCGCNIVNSICLNGMSEVSFTLVNRERLSDYSSEAGKILVSMDEENLDKTLSPLLTVGAHVSCRHLFQNHPQTLVVVAGMGGKYSARIAAALCRLHKARGARSVAFVTMPFSFEHKDAKAAEDLALVSQQATQVITFDNNTLYQLPDIPVHDAFRQVDDEVVKVIESEKMYAMLKKCESFFLPFPPLE
jgi:cell division protein FtsZ